MKKKCDKCKQSKNEIEFHKDKDKKDGLCTICKNCKKENSKKYRKFNKDKIKK